MPFAILLIRIQMINHRSFCMVMVASLSIIEQMKLVLLFEVGQSILQ